VARSKGDLFKQTVTVTIIAPAEGSKEGIWTVYVDGSSNLKGSRAGVIIENDEGIIIEVSLGLSFAMTNNTAEHESFLASLMIASDMGARMSKICTDSQLVASKLQANTK